LRGDGPNQIVAASTSGTHAHWKVEMSTSNGDLFSSAGSGGLVGAGDQAAACQGNADFVIKMTMLMLGIVGVYMFVEHPENEKEAAGSR
jgi:hypothetical protein